ncbi:MAG: TIGR03936 family radical SAM-associated protein [Planctomycetota bacterium]
MVLIKFKVRGNLRFLSHAELLKLFQRACVRAGIKTAYTEGFNPRPKLSLPLPKSVGIETDNDLLCLQLQNGRQTPQQLKDDLAKQLPEDCQVLSITLSRTNTKPQPCLAKYVLKLRRHNEQVGKISEKLKETIKHLLKSKTLNLDRQINVKGNIRKVDVRGFIKSIEFDGKSITVECKITPAGSIRVQEILKLLQLDADMLAAPIRRTGVQWQKA